MKVCGSFLLIDSVSLMQYLRLYIVRTFDIYTYIYICIIYIYIHIHSIHASIRLLPWTSVFIGSVSPELLDLVQGSGGTFPKGLCKSQEFKVG